MHKPQQDVREFHRAIAHSTSPAPPMLREPMLRASLMLEEAMETACALVGASMAKALLSKIMLDIERKLAAGQMSDRPNIIEAIDGCIDTLVVTYGTLENIGVDAEPFWDEVHRANMAKTTGPVRADGKRMKPDGWVPPDIGGVLGRVQLEASWKR